MAMNAVALGDGQLVLTGDPQCCVVWDAIHREVGVRVNHPPGMGLACSRQAVDVVEVLLVVLGQTRDQLQDIEALFDAVEALRDPSSLVVRIIAATAQVAAVSAGLEGEGLER
jgi:hypothetical protein